MLGKMAANTTDCVHDVGKCIATDRSAVRQDAEFLGFTVYLSPKISYLYLHHINKFHVFCNLESLFFGGV